MSHRHFILNKPYGYLSQFVYELKRKKMLLAELYDFPAGTMAIGRLDEDSEGLLLLTTDGKMSEIVRSKKVDKEYYVQVIDSKNNVLGDKQTINFDQKTLTYSFISKVKYENKTVNVSEDLPGKDFAKGTYFVNVFDKSELVSKTSFTLK